MASIKMKKDKDGKVRFYVQVRIKGYPQQNAAFTRKTDAERWIQQTEAAIREGRHFKTVEAKKHSVGQMIDRYIRDVLPTKKRSEKKQTSQLNWWKERIGHCLLSDVTPALIAEQRDFLLKGKTMRGSIRSSSTVVRYMAALSHSFSIAMREWGWIEDSPCRKVSKPKEPRGRVRFLNEEERISLLQACRDSENPYLFIIVVLTLSCGFRQAEVMNLKWSAIDLQRGRIVLHETKNGEIRQAPLAGLALELVAALDKVRRIDTQLLFPGKFPKKPIIIRTAWLNALKKANIEDFRFHDLRHSTASYLAMNGATLAEIAEVLGHKTLAMVKRYAHISDTHTSKVVADMNQKIFG